MDTGLKFTLLAENLAKKLDKAKAKALAKSLRARMKSFNTLQDASANKTPTKTQNCI